MGAAEAALNANTTEHRAMRWVRVLLFAWVFALVLALYPYVTNPAAPVKYLLSAWLAVAMSAAYAMAVARGNERPHFGGGVLGLALGLIAMHALAAIAGDAPLRGLVALRGWVLGLVVALLAAQALRAPEHAARVLLAVCAAVALSSAYGFLQRFGLDPFPWGARGIEEYAGMPSTYANPNFAGHALLLALLLTGGLLAWRRQWLWLLLPCFALIASHLYLTHMRGARVGLLAALAFTGVVSWLSRRSGAAVRAGTLLLAVAAAAVGALVGGALLYAQDPGGALPLDGASVLRLNGYHGAARMALAQPLLGHGPGSFDTQGPRYWTPYEQQWFASEGKKNDHVHNDLLETAADAGLPAAALYIGLLVAAILASLRLVRGEDAAKRPLGWMLAACFVAFGVDGLFGFNLRVPVSEGFFFLLLGVLLAQVPPPIPHATRPGAILTAALLLVASLAAALGSSAVFQAETLLQQARGAQAYGKAQRDAGNLDGTALGFEAGIRLGRAAAHWWPHDARNMEIAGQCAMALGRFTQADEHFAAALIAAPNSPTLLSLQAQARASQLLERDRLDVFGDAPDPELTALATRVETPARAALALCPMYAPAEEVLGRTLQVKATNAQDVDRDVLTEARTLLERALRHGARSRADLSGRIATMAETLGDPDDAEAAFRRAVELAPDNDKLWDDYREFARRNARTATYAEALAQRAAHATGPTQDDLLLRLAFLAAFDLGDTARGRAIAAEVCRRSPGQPAAWGLLVLASGELSPAGLKAVLGEGDATAAPAWIQTLADAPTGAAFAQAAQATLAAMPDGPPATAVSRDYRWAALLLDRALPGATLTPKDAGPARRAIAGIYRRCGRYAEALQNAEAAAALLSGAARAEATLLSSQALAGMGREREALTKAREATRLAPGSKTARHALARLLLAEGLLAEARFEYAALVKAPPPGAEAAIGLEARQLEARLAAQAAGSPKP